jgi:hypothetical protein
MSGAPQVAMRSASQIWQIFFPLQTFRKRAQYLVVIFFRIFFQCGHDILKIFYHT